MNIQTAQYSIEKAIEKLGVDPEKTRGTNKNQWDLYKGKLHLMLDLFAVSEKKAFFQILSPISDIPENECDFFKFLLEQNHTIVGASVTKFKDKIYLKNIREISELTTEEILNLITSTSIHAEELIQKMKEIFN